MKKRKSKPKSVGCQCRICRKEDRREAKERAIKTKRCWTIFYTVENGPRIFRSIVKASSTADAVAKLKGEEGALGSGLVYAGKLAEPYTSF